MSKTLFVEKNKCNGCYACITKCPQKCISMKIDEKGFWYPEIDDKKCINCGLCEKVCKVKKRELFSDFTQAYAVVNNDKCEQQESSSGGIFSLFAKAILNSEGVVFGATFDENSNVVHKVIEHESDLYKLRGSKYVQSNIGNTYLQAEEFLKKNKKVLFSGTPCQIEGLLAYLGKRYDNLYTQDIICHGVPSPKIWDNYVKYNKGKRNSEVEKINFRDKRSGWEGCSLSMLFENGKEYKKEHTQDFYMKAFLKNLSLRDSCYNCAFKTKERNADITLGDFWGVKEVAPEMYDSNGVSLLIIHSNKGQKFFEKIKGQVKYKEVNIDDALKYNSAMCKSVEKPQKREEFFEDAANKGWKYIEKKYFKEKFITKIKIKIKQIIKHKGQRREEDVII